MYGVVVNGPRVWRKPVIPSVNALKVLRHVSFSIRYCCLDGEPQNHAEWDVGLKEEMEKRVDELGERKKALRRQQTLDAAVREEIR